MAQGSPVLVVLLAAVAVGYASGGRIRRFASIQIHWWGLAFVGLGMQLVPVPELGGLDEHTVGFISLTASYAALLIFLAGNRRVPAAHLMGIGLALNLAVVLVNGGMPVSGSAIERASDLTSVGTPTLIEWSAKHHLMTDADQLSALGDVIPVPPPAGVVLSIGDVFLYLGMAWFVIQVMRGRSRANPRPIALWFPAYRGKHAPDHWRMSARYRTPDHAEGAQQGT